MIFCPDGFTVHLIFGDARFSPEYKIRKMVLCLWLFFCFMETEAISGNENLSDPSQSSYRWVIPYPPGLLYAVLGW